MSKEIQSFLRHVHGDLDKHLGIDSRSNHDDQFSIGTRIYSCDLNTMDHPDLIVCSFIDNSIGLNRVKIKILYLFTITNVLPA